MPSLRESVNGQCDGRQRCEAFSTGPLENFPYYNQAAEKCFHNVQYCGKRDKAKYHNHQCFSVSSQFGDTDTHSMEYQCLNRLDISEKSIRNSMNFENFVSGRKNLFQYFKANDTINQVTKSQIICGVQKINRDCTDINYGARIECKKEETDDAGSFVSNYDVCDALDFLEEKGLPAPPMVWTTHIYGVPSVPFPSGMKE